MCFSLPVILSFTCHLPVLLVFPFSFVPVLGSGVHHSTKPGAFKQLQGDLLWGSVLPFLASQEEFDRNCINHGVG